MIVFDDADPAFTTDGQWNTGIPLQAQGHGQTYGSTAAATYTEGAACWWDTGPIVAGNYRVLSHWPFFVGGPVMRVDVLEASGPATTVVVATGYQDQGRPPGDDAEGDGVPFEETIAAVHIPHTGARLRITCGPRPGFAPGLADALALDLISADPPPSAGRRPGSGLVPARNPRPRLPWK